MGEREGTKTIDGGRDHRWIEAKSYGVTGFHLPVAVFVISTKGGITSRKALIDGIQFLWRIRLGAPQKYVISVAHLKLMRHRNKVGPTPGQPQ
jgi:hypothetical protein